MATKNRKRRLSMNKIHEMLRLHLKLKLKVRHIARACKISTSTAHNYVEKIRKSQISWEKAERMTEEELQQVLFPDQGKRENQKPMPDFEYLNKELRKKNVTLQLLWEEYIADNPGGYCMSSSFKWRRQLC